MLMVCIGDRAVVYLVLHKGCCDGAASDQWGIYSQSRYQRSKIPAMVTESRKLGFYRKIIDDKEKSDTNGESQ